MDADTLFLLLRVAVALGVVVAVLWFVRRRFAKGNGTGASAAKAAPAGRRTLLGMRSRGSGASVRGRHALGQKSSVAVVEFDGREFLLGVSEQGVTVLHAAQPEPTPAAPEQVRPAPDFAAHLAAAELAAAQPGPEAGLAPAAAGFAETAPPARPLAAPRYARSTAPVPDPGVEVDDEQPAYLVPAPVPVRHLLTGTFVAEVELLPMPAPVAEPTTYSPTTYSPTAVPPASAPVPPTPMPPMPAAPTRAALLPNTSMIPVVVTAPAPQRAPAVAAPAPAPVTVTVPYPQPHLHEAPVPRLAEPASSPAPVAMQWPVLKPASARAEAPVAEPAEPAEPAGAAARAAGPLAGSILSPDTWRRTADAFRALR